MLPHLDAERLRALFTPAAAADALERALAGGLDPEQGGERLISRLSAGDLILLPAESGPYAGISVRTEAGANPARALPRVQGVYVLLDARTLSPLATMDDAELALITTPAVTTVAVRALLAALGRDGIDHLAVIGTSVQAHRHVQSLAAVLGVGRVSVLGRRPASVAAFVGEGVAPGLTVRAGRRDDLRTADVILTATSSPAPVLSCADVGDGTVVAAIGSHGLDAREIDPELARRCQVVVEARRAAMAWSGNLIPARSVGDWESRGLANLADLVHRRFTPTGGGPLLYTGHGMAWENLVLAGEAYDLVRAEAAKQAVFL